MKQNHASHHYVSDHLCERSLLNIIHNKKSTQVSNIQTKLIL